MAVSDVIRLGDKIDIRLIQKKENGDETGEAPHIYKSRVLEVKKNGNLEITMPIEQSKVILLPTGVRFEFVFYSHNGGLYKSTGLVVERYKKEGFFMCEITLKTPLEKIQRREFYRYICATDFVFYMLTEEQKAMETAEEVFRDLMFAEQIVPPYEGVMVDLSGGGMKFRSPFELPKDEKIMTIIPLVNEQMDREYRLLAYVVSCNALNASAKDLYETRVRFEIKDVKVREEIIRFIFEEERKIRRKENG